LQDLRSLKIKIYPRPDLPSRARSFDLVGVLVSK